LAEATSCRSTLLASELGLFGKKYTQDMHLTNDGSYESIATRPMAWLWCVSTANKSGISQSVCAHSDQG